MDRQQALKKEWSLASLNDKQKEELKQLENDLGVVLIAYEHGENKH
ncbi:hypothetical protein [Pueribacillus sp. YX66]